MNFDMNSSLGFVLNRTAFSSKVSFNKKLKKYNISPEQWSVIYRIVENPGISQKELSDSTYKDQGNLTRMIDKLIDNGFIEKMIDENNRRSIKLFPANKAIEFSEEIIPLSILHNETLVDGFTSDECEILLNLLNKVYKNIQKGE